MDPQLGLALSLPLDEREKSEELSLGYDPVAKKWELVVQYIGSLEAVVEELNLSVVYLFGDYAIIQVEEEKVMRLLRYPEVAYVEKPRLLQIEQQAEGVAASCIPSVRREPYGLTGAGTLICIADSGIDYSHRAFRKEDGSTRILGLWDQTIEGNPPEGFYIGSFYSEADINEALSADSISERKRIVPSTDISGHGTHVAGIAASKVAPEASLLIVKLGNRRNQSTPKTTELMQAVTFAKRFADRADMPLSVNLSFGNNYGAHDGTALLERYLDSLASTARISISVGTGNDGATARHVSRQISYGSLTAVEWVVAPYESSLNLQIWKNLADDFEFVLITPEGRRYGPFGQNDIILTGNVYTSYRGVTTNIEIYQGLPTPYNQNQQIFIEFLPTRTYISEVIWRLEIQAKQVVNGFIRFYLPVAEGTSSATGFARPSIDGTLTIPSSASRVISVAAYNSITGSQVAFSGRGFSKSGEIKPDLAAPGVDIYSAAPGGGYSLRTGTSMATPFVSGSAALLMQWGIIMGNDPYLYGEKLRSYLIRGARRLPGYTTWPNPQLGWGVLCVRDSLPAQV